MKSAEASQVPKTVCPVLEMVWTALRRPRDPMCKNSWWGQGLVFLDLALPCPFSLTAHVFN